MDNSSLFREKYSFKFAKVKEVYTSPNKNIELWSRVDRSMRHMIKINIFSKIFYLNQYF